MKYETSNNVYSGCKTCIIMPVLLLRSVLSRTIIGSASCSGCNWPSSDAPARLKF
jgi:hypothetical protein